MNSWYKKLPPTESTTTLVNDDVSVRCISNEDETQSRRLLQTSASGIANMATLTLTGNAADTRTVSGIGAVIMADSITAVDSAATLLGFASRVLQIRYNTIVSLLLIPASPNEDEDLIDEIKERVGTLKNSNQHTFSDVTVSRDNAPSVGKIWSLNANLDVWFNVVDAGSTVERLTDANYEIGRLLDALSRVGGVVMTSLLIVTYDREEINIRTGAAPFDILPYDAASDFTDQGLEVTYRTDLNQLKDWKGNSAVKVHRLPSRTEYILAMAVTFVSPQHPGDTNHKEYRSVCRDAKYKLGVESEMTALTSFDLGSGGNNGGSGGNAEDQVYLASSGYIACDTSFTCDETIGPQYKCSVGADHIAERRLEYVVHMDLAKGMRTDRVVEYKVSTPADVSIPEPVGCGGNCYGNFFKR